MRLVPLSVGKTYSPSIQGKDFTVLVLFSYVYLIQVLCPVLGNRLIYLTHRLPEPCEISVYTRMVAHSLTGLMTQKLLQNNTKSIFPENGTTTLDYEADVLPTMLTRHLSTSLVNNRKST